MYLEETSSSTNNAQSFINYGNNSSGWVTIDGTGISASIEKKKGFKPRLVFKLLKKKMGILANKRYKTRIAKLEKLAIEALDNGQEAFGDKFLKELLSEMKQSELYAEGYRLFLSKEFYDKFKYKADKDIRLTFIKNYARPIPKSALKKKDEADKKKLFEDYMIMHADEPSTVEETVKEIVEREKDPILFGVSVDCPGKLFFIAEWLDEHCNLTFDDIVDTLGLEEDDVVIGKKPNIIKDEG